MSNLTFMSNFKPAHGAENGVLRAPRAVSAPFVHGAFAAGKLSSVFGTIGCPAPTTR